MKNDIEFANLTVTTSDGKVIIDLFDDFILPAFLRDYERETHFNTTYLFNKCGVANIGRRHEREVIIYGRLIKNEQLEREQYYSQGQLIEDHQSMPSSPSSLFVITLSDHKIMYFRETDNAPGIEAFGNTLRYFVKLARLEYIDKVVKDYKSGVPTPENYLDPKLKRPTKKHLYEVIKKIDVEVIYIPSSQSINDFISGFETINLVEAEVAETNHEIDFSELIGDVRKQRKELSADTGLVRFYSKEGLNKQEAGNIIRETGASGNARLKIKGLGRNGETRTGNNDKFKVTLHLGLLGSTQPEEIASTLVDSYDTLVEKGSVTPAAVATPREKVRRVIEFISRVFNTPL